MARLASLLLYVFAIVPVIFIIVCGLHQNKEYCSQQKSNVTFGHRKVNDTLLLKRFVMKKGIPGDKTSSKLEWFPPKNGIKTLDELRPTFINVVDKNKLCGCNNTVLLNSIVGTGSSKNITGLEIFSSPGCPINTLIELWGKNGTKSHSIVEE